MKIGQLLLGLPLALLFCTAVVLTEKDRLERFDVQNPFRSQVELSTYYDNTTKENRFFLTPNREIMVLASGAKFTLNNRTLEKGRIFIDHQFLSINDITASRVIDPSTPPPPSLKSDKLKLVKL